MLIKYDGGSYTCNGKELFNLLLERSSLREDIKKEISEILTDILDSIELTDELVARVSDKTYEFIKDYKEK